MNKRFIFGTNALTELLVYYLISNNEMVDGIALNADYITDTTYKGIRVYAIEELIEKYGVNNISIYVTVAYTNMNRTREKVFSWIKKQGISILSYRHPSANIADNAILGEGNIILENCIIQPFVSIGDGNIIWNNANISHHCEIGSYNYFSPSSTIAGRVQIGDRNFLGINSMIKNDIYLRNEVLVGAGAYVNRNLESGSVFLPQKSVLLEDKISTDIYIQ